MAVAANATFKENIEFSILLDIEDFEDGRQACQGLDSPTELASFASLEEYNFSLETIDTIDEPIEFLWIGLQRESDNISDADDIAEAFQFLDGTPNVITNTPFVFPWATDEPVNRNLNKFCAAISIEVDRGEFQTLNDQRCTKNSNDQGAVCKRYLSDSATQVASDGSYQITVVTLENTTRTFDDGIAACSVLDPPGELASFSNEEEFNLILDTIHLVPPLGIAWVGLKSFSDEDNDASFFEFLDGTSNEFTSVGNQFPWGDDEPNDADVAQECVSVAYNFGQPNRLDNLPCSGARLESFLIGAVCKQVLLGPSALTPTVSPTFTPTVSPILTPTVSPTLTPTVLPTEGIQNMSMFLLASSGAMFILVFAMLLILLKDERKTAVLKEQLKSVTSRE